MGRLLRGPDDPNPDPDPSLITDPNPNPDPVDPNKPADPDPNKPADPDPNKPADPEPEPVEPLKLEDVTVPEGFELQPEMANKFLEILNGDMAPKDRANALIALHGETMSAASEASSKAWEDMQTEWKDEAKADPDIGGAKLQPTLTNIGKLIDEFGDEKVRGVFDLTGAGNNPHMIKFLGKIADKLTEGNFFKASSPSNADDPNAAAKRLFPSMKG